MLNDICTGITTNGIVLCSYAIGNAVSQFMWKAQYQPRCVTNSFSGIMGHAKFDLGTTFHGL
jgi:hypothetical protein